MIEPDHPKLSVTRQCELLGLPRSSFYYEPKAPSEDDQRMMRRIDELYLAYPFYGSRQMTRALRREGHAINRKRVQRLMRLMGLEAIYQRPNLSRPDAAHKIYPYLLRTLAVTRPNQVWATDITYVPIQGGFIYLCAVIDWFSRRVLAWELSNTLDATFCVRAVARAIDKLVSMLPGGPSAPERDLGEVRQALLPRLVPRDFLDDSPGMRDELALKPVLGGALHAALILGYEGRARYVRQRELAHWSLAPGDALAIALENLAARSARARFARVDTAHGPLVVARTGDGLDGARLLLPTLHDVLAPELGSPFLAAAPHRDALFACAIEPRELRDALAARVRDDAARAPHRISDRLFAIAAHGIRPWLG